MVGLTFPDKKQTKKNRGGIQKANFSNSLVYIKENKWAWAEDIMHRIDKRWSARATEWTPRDGYLSRIGGGKLVEVEEPLSSHESYTISSRKKG